MPEYAPSLDAFNDWQYESQKHRISDTYFSGLDKNRWQQAVGEANKTQQVNKLNLGYERSEGGFRSSFAQRGLRNSGLYDTAASQRLQDINRSRNEIGQNFDLQKYGLGIEAGHLTTSYNQGLNDVEVQKQRSRDLVASSLTR